MRMQAVDIRPIFSGRGDEASRVPEMQDGSTRVSMTTACVLARLTDLYTQSHD